MKKYKTNPGQIISRKELKNIKGGDGTPPPATPSGGACALRKCCITGTSNCSACITVSSTATCAGGSTLTLC